MLLQGIDIKNKKALPDTFELFEGQYIDPVTKKIKNIDALKRRIVGLSSYFRSAQENLLPRYNKTLGVDYHIVRIPMSNFQFGVYESARREERKSEKKKPKQTVGELYEDSSSTYRIFSRLFCNFVMPDRPIPLKKSLSVKGKEGEEEGVEKEGEDNMSELFKLARREEAKQDVIDDQEGEVEDSQFDIRTIFVIPTEDNKDQMIYHMHRNCESLFCKEYEEKIPCKLCFEKTEDTLNSMIGSKMLGFALDKVQYHDEDCQVLLSRKERDIELRTVCLLCQEVDDIAKAINESRGERATGSRIV